MKSAYPIAFFFTVLPKQDQKQCSLLSRLPASFTPAKPPATMWERAAGASPYNPKCASGYSTGES